MGRLTRQVAVLLGKRHRTEDSRPFIALDIYVRFRAESGRFGRIRE
jgi:hypothetical protein